MLLLRTAFAWERRLQRDPRRAIASAVNPGCSSSSPHRLNTGLRPEASGAVTVCDLAPWLLGFRAFSSVGHCLPVAFQFQTHVVPPCPRGGLTLQVAGFGIRQDSGRPALRTWGCLHCSQPRAHCCQAGSGCAREPERKTAVRRGSRKAGNADVWRVRGRERLGEQK